MANEPVEVNDVNDGINNDDLDAFESNFFGSGTAEPQPENVEEPEEEIVDPVDDTDATEATAGETGDEDDPEAEEDEEEEVPDEEPEPDPGPQQKPKKKSAKDRIDELTAEKYAEKRRADELERRLAALEARDSQPREEKPSQKPAAVADPEAPRPDAVDDNGEMIFPLGEFDPRFIADLTAHAFQKEAAAAREAQKQEAEQRRQQEEDRALAEAWEGKLVESEKEIPELRGSLSSLETHFADLEPTYGTYLAKTIMGMDQGPEVLYYLAQNPDEADKIVASGPTGATLALGRLEAKIQSALAKKATPTPRATAAPKPPITTRGNGGRVATRGDTENLDEFEALFFKK